MRYRNARKAQTKFGRLICIVYLSSVINVSSYGHFMPSIDSSKLEMSVTYMKGYVVNSFVRLGHAPSCNHAGGTRLFTNFLDSGDVPALVQQRSLFNICCSEEGFGFLKRSKAASKRNVRHAAVTAGSRRTEHRLRCRAPTFQWRVAGFVNGRRATQFFWRAPW